MAHAASFWTAVAQSAKARRVSVAVLLVSLLRISATTVWVISSDLLPLLERSPWMAKTVLSFSFQFYLCFLFSSVNSFFVSTGKPSMFCQALCDHIPRSCSNSRSGSLSIPDMFTHVLSQVEHESGGAQTPYSESCLRKPLPLH